MERRLQRFAILLMSCVVLAGMFSLPAAAWEREALSAFHERRVKLLRETGSDGVIVLFGYHEQDVAASTTPFRQNENFYYLTGWDEPDAMLMLVPRVGQARVE